MMRITKRGYYTIEAALFLPIFIIAMITLAYVIRVICIEERITHIITDEAKYLSARAYDNRSAVSALKMGLFLDKHLHDRFDQEVNYNTPYSLTDYRYLFEADGLTGLIAYSISYQAQLNMPINLVDGKSFEKRLVFRGFIGADRDEDAFDYESMEDEFDSVLVWVFPKAGEKYHAENCRHIKVYPRQITLSKSLMGQYKSCRHCARAKPISGSLVYIFNASGDVYHYGDCFLVDRYVISLDLESAKSKGYIPCKTCGGGADH